MIKVICTNIFLLLMLQACCSISRFSEPILNERIDFIKQSMKTSKVIFIGKLVSLLPPILPPMAPAQSGTMELSYEVERSLMNLENRRASGYIDASLLAELGGQDDSTSGIQKVLHKVNTRTYMFPQPSPNTSNTILSLNQSYIVFLHNSNISTSPNFGAIPATEENIKKVKCLMLSFLNRVPES